MQTSQPNILLAIADDQSWRHTGAQGCRFVKTPGFDRIAAAGVLFNHAYCPAPQCAPSRASLLTGRNIWQNQEAGTHGSLFPAHLQVYPDLLETVGYRAGYTGKAWGPGNWKDTGRPRNPAGNEFNRLKLTPPNPGISDKDYAGNFEDFMRGQPAGQPFCFWYGGHEPHRPYDPGSGLQAGKRLEDVEVPPFLPDDPIVRGDLLDYAQEIEWFDRHLCRMLALLEERGMLENTIVVVTADNGMPFPRAKANQYEYGAHIPMTVAWPAAVPGGRRVDDCISLIDLAPTFLEAAGMTVPEAMSGRSLLPTLQSTGTGLVDQTRQFAVTGRERHSHSRFDNLGYPVRAIHTLKHVYIWNLAPDRLPAGDQYHDVDAGPSKDLIINHRQREDLHGYFEMAFGKRPEEELYERESDPCCMVNVIDRPEMTETRQSLRGQLEDIMRAQADPRILGYGDIFEAYPRYMSMRKELGGFVERDAYHGKYLEKARQAMRDKGYTGSEIARLCAPKVVNAT